MGRLKYATDSAYARPWAERIGKLILNFAGLELESLLWLVQMSEQVDRIPEFVKTPFASRVRLITGFADLRAFEEPWKLAARSAWADARELAKLRNRIAHNPLLFAWATEAALGEPDFIGVPDVRAPKDALQNQGPLLSKTDVEAVINHVAALVTRLAALRDQWCVVRDARAGAS